MYIQGPAKARDAVTGVDGAEKCSVRLAFQPANLNGGRLFHRAVVLAARPMRIGIFVFPARRQPAPLEEPQGRTPFGPTYSDPTGPDGRDGENRPVPLLFIFLSRREGFSCCA